MRWNFTATLMGCALASPAWAGGTLHLPSMPHAAGQVAALVLQNAGQQQIGAHYLTTGIVFPKGAVPAGQHLKAELGSTGKTTPVQMDERTHWPDGSVRTAAISFNQPTLPAGASRGLALLPSNSTSVPPLSLASISPGVATVDLTVGGTPHHLDVAALLGSGTPNYWLRGPLATEARVNAPISGALNVTIDVRVYADGSSTLDAIFANDLAKAHGGAVSYVAAIKLGKVTPRAVTINKQQPFTNWHQRLWSAGAPSVNVVHDIPLLEQTGMVPRYPLAAGVPASAIAAEVVNQARCRPLGPCGITAYMPTTGARADIGLVPLWDLFWLQTQDPHAAAYALAQADAAGSIPWHVEQAPGVPVNVTQHPMWWSDDRCHAWGNTDCSPMSYQAAIAGSGNDTAITPDCAHQPEMAYVPYLLTGSRYYLDELAAQAGYSESNTWQSIRDYGRDNGGSGGEAVIGAEQQLRAGAWSIRELGLASLVEPDGSALQSYFSKATAINMSYTAQLASNPAKGQMIGWVDSLYAMIGAIAPWQEDYLALTLQWQIHAGVPGASTALAAMTPFLVKRFIQPPGTFSPYDATAYNLMVGVNSTHFFTTWAQSEKATISVGTSNTTRPLGPPPGTWSSDYGALGTATVRGLPSSPTQQAALAWIQAHPAPQSQRPAWMINP